MADNNYSVDEILSELKTRSSAAPSGEAAFSEKKYTEEDMRLLAKALEYEKAKNSPFFTESASRAPRQEVQQPNQTEKWQPIAAQTVTPLRQVQPSQSASPRAQAPQWDGTFASVSEEAPQEPSYTVRQGGSSEAAPTGNGWDALDELWGSEVPKTKAPEPKTTVIPPKKRRIDTAAAARAVTGGGFEQEDRFDEDFEARLLKEAGRAAGTPLESASMTPRTPQPVHLGPKSKKKENWEGDQAAPRGKRSAEENTGRVSGQIAKMKNGLIVRLVVNLLVAVLVVYFILAPEYQLPLPGFLDSAGMGAYLWICVGLTALSALVSGNTVGGGILSLFCLRPNNDSYTALGVFACLVQGAYMAMRPEIYTTYSANLYLPMAGIMLLFNTLGKFVLIGRVEKTYQLMRNKNIRFGGNVVSDRSLARKLGGDAIVDDDANVAYYAPATSFTEYMNEAFSESKTEDISKVVAPMTAVAGLVMAIVSYAFNKDVFIAACVFTASLCITSPIAGVIASNLPLSLVNGRLSRWKAALCGYRSVAQFGSINGVVLRCTDLFPASAVTLHGIKVLNKRPIDDAILDAASVIAQCDSTLSSVFKEIVPSNDVLRPVESIGYEDGMGISAWVNGRRVLVGNRQLMLHYGIDIPSPDFEARHTQGGKDVLYLSNSGEVAAMYILSYKADKQVRRAMELLYDRDIAVTVYTTDPNITSKKIAQVFDFPEDLSVVMPASLQQDTDALMASKGKQRVGLIHDGSPASFVRALVAARSCSSTVAAETALLLVSIIIGFAIVTFFAFTRTMPTLTWMAVAAYQLFWMVLQLVLPLLRKG